MLMPTSAAMPSASPPANAAAAPNACASVSKGNVMLAGQMAVTPRAAS